MKYIGPLIDIYGDFYTSK